MQPILNRGHSPRIGFIVFAYHVGIIFARYSCNTIHAQRFYFP